MLLIPRTRRCANILLNWAKAPQTQGQKLRRRAMARLDRHIGKLFHDGQLTGTEKTTQPILTSLSTLCGHFCGEKGLRTQCL